MRIILAALFVILPLIWPVTAVAAGRQQFTVETPSGPILLEVLATGMALSRPSVLILSGSRGFGAPAYGEISQTFGEAGLDVYLVHILSPADINAIASAGSAHARIAYYAKRFPDWIAEVRAVLSYIEAQPHHAGKIGIVGISLGAEIAAAASVNRADIGALVLVDGGFPNGYSQPVTALPPLQLIWGGADRTFPVSIARELHRKAQALGKPANLEVYEGGSHDFFLRKGAPQTIVAHKSAARFLTSQLSR